MRCSVRSLLSNTSGAVAPTVALSLVALIAAGGVAFDYARMAAMDTELQNAADQAALAAASQLDGQTNACSRAAAAAVGMITNRTIMANEGGSSSAVNIQSEPGCDATGSIKFYQNIQKTVAATSDENAKFVEVTVDPREAFFALTPVVAAVSSGQLTATAFAGLGEAICKVPPLMLCNPHESTDPDFDVSTYVGKGIRLVANDGGGGYGPGNFGFLDSNAGSGASTLRTLLGRTNIPGDCLQETGVTTEPGAMVSVLDALNTRFDIYANGLTQACGGSGSLCPPSANTRKDVMKGSGGGSNSCAFQAGAGNVGWKIPTSPYLPANSTPLTDAQISTLSPMGFPRDICHARSDVGFCSGGRIGDGVWDRYAYFKSNTTNYPEINAGTFTAKMNEWFGTTTPSRYDVYRWEMQNAATRLRSQVQGNRTAYGSPVCTTPGVTPTATNLDRRVISAAVINCTAQGIRGRTANVEVTKWIDLFLVEPSLRRARTEQSDVYVEVIRATENSTEEAAFQEVKKSVPYLIE